MNSIKVKKNLASSSSVPSSTKFDYTVPNKLPTNTVASKLFAPIDICILTLAVMIIALGESELT